MEILGIGPLELLFILIIALIVLGPNDMVKAGRTLGRLMRKVVTSPTWRTLQDASREMRSLPNRLIREAGIEELQNNLPNLREVSKDLGVEQLKADLTSLEKDLSVSTGPNPSIKPPDLPTTTDTEMATSTDVTIGTDVASGEDITIDTPETPPDLPAPAVLETPNDANNPAPPSPDSPIHPSGQE